MFRSRFQTIGIRGAASFSAHEGPNKWVAGIGQPARDRWALTRLWLAPTALNDREQGKNHLSGETKRSGERAVAGKLNPERSTKHGTQSDLSRHQYREPD